MYLISQVWFSISWLLIFLLRKTSRIQFNRSHRVNIVQNIIPMYSLHTAPHFIRVYKSFAINIPSVQGFVNWSTHYYSLLYLSHLVQHQHCILYTTHCSIKIVGSYLLFHCSNFYIQKKVKIGCLSKYQFCESSILKRKWKLLLNENWCNISWWFIF